MRAPWCGRRSPRRTTPRPSRSSQNWSFDLAEDGKLEQEGIGRRAREKGATLRLLAAYDVYVDSQDVDRPRGHDVRVGGATPSSTPKRAATPGLRERLRLYRDQLSLRVSVLTPSTRRHLDWRSGAGP